MNMTKNNIPKVAICALVKNTPDYLMKEWINHHFNIGISEIHVFIDINSNPIYRDNHVTYTELTIDDIVEFNAISQKYCMHEDLGISTQIGLYNTFLENHRDDFDWIAYIDDDEFLELDLTMLNDNKEETCVVLPWKMMFTNKLSCDFTLNDYEEYPPLMKYVGSSKFVKSIVNTKKIWKIRCIHYADLTNEIYNTTNINSKFGKATQDKILDVFNNAKYYIKHYKVRSFSEWVDSIISRGYFIHRKYPENLWDRSIKNYFLNHPMFENNPEVNNAEFIKEVIIKIGKEDILNTPFCPGAKIPVYPEKTGVFEIIYNMGTDRISAEDLNKFIVPNKNYIIIDYLISNSYYHQLENLSSESIIFDKNIFILWMINKYKLEFNQTGNTLLELDAAKIVLSEMFPNIEF